ncbi:MAG: aminodeoxychorismate/anthranilate synthase component II [Planctomycetota bacterium]
MILLIDNRDSFVFNLAHELQRQGGEVVVRPCASTSATDVLAAVPAGLVLGPGPGGPAAARLSLELARALAGRIPILGVCLGHQVIAEAYGGRTVRSPQPVHGRAVTVEHDGAGLLRGVRNPARLARYNSLTVEAASLPAELEITARSDDGEVLGLRHVRLALEGVQFHPESIESTDGARILANFVAQVRAQNSSEALR